MLSYSIYLNSLRMMIDRGYEDAEALLDEISKDDEVSFLYKDSYHNIGYNFKKFLRSEIKEVEERFMMSYCLKDEAKMEKQFVLFVTNSKAFLTIITEIMLDNHDDFKLTFNLITSKDFGTKINQKIDVLAGKFDIFRFYDYNLVKLPYHIYGPKYELMTEKEISDLLSSLMIPKKKMRRISYSDPMIKYLGIPSGKVVRVRRSPMISGSLVKETLDYLFVI